MSQKINNCFFFKEKPFLQSKITLLKGKFFPPKLPFPKYKRKISGKGLLCKGTMFFF
jgi:hypothetical protein